MPSVQSVCSDLHVNVVNGISDVLEDRFERHEEVTVLEAVLDSGG